MPAELWSYVAVFCFWGWVLTVFMVIFKGFPLAGVVQGKKAALYAGLSLVFICFWVVGLLNA